MATTSRHRKAAVEKLTDAGPVFAALGDATRLKIVARLCTDGPQSIVNLSEDAGVTRQAVTKHLQTLAAAGLVHDAWRGRERIWELEPRRLQVARRCLDHIAAEWNDAIRRLKTFVEHTP